MLLFHIPGISLKGLTVELLAGNNVSLVTGRFPLWQTLTWPGPSNMARDRARTPLQAVFLTAITHIPITITTHTHTNTHSVTVVFYVKPAGHV